MASVSLTINGRRYEIACDAGQEDQISKLGRQVDDRVRQLVAAVGQLGDSRLLVMTALLLADELSDKSNELKSLKAEYNSSVRERKEEWIAEKILIMANRLEEMAALLSPEVARMETQGVQAVIDESEKI